MARTTQQSVAPKPRTKAPTKSAASSPSDLEGKTAPDFTLPDQDGRLVALRDLRKRGDVVLYFYPKDMTPGCTNEACSFRDKFDQLHAAGAQVVGVSADRPESHRKFIEKYELSFPLLSDPNHEVTKAYRVYKRKSLYGREFMGIERTTFIIGRDGTVRRVFPKVKVNGHVDEVLASLAKPE
ncbi:MAG TPA: thioredoxin-dependent thiol peroxidase [Candidatus Binataceae bacterium]|nr:thioredoxin-dependent thiol peroxidase [Candidatus Binataceae bacterium]